MWSIDDGLLGKRLYVFDSNVGNLVLGLIETDFKHESSESILLTLEERHPGVLKVLIEERVEVLDPT